MTPESTRTLGGLGAILLFIGLMPVQYVGILALVGFILVLIALHGFANIYGERGIFNNFLYGTVVGIIGTVAAAVAAVISVLTTVTSLLYKIYPGWNGDWTALPTMMPDTSSITAGDVLPLLGELILVFGIIWVTIIIASFFARRSLNALSAKTGVGLFSTAALVLLIGAFLTIILIGFLIIWIAVLLLAIAFFQIKIQPGQPSAPASSMPAP